MPPLVSTATLSSQLQLSQIQSHKTILRIKMFFAKLLPLVLATLVVAQDDNGGELVRSCATFSEDIANYLDL